MTRRLWVEALLFGLCFAALIWTWVWWPGQIGAWLVFAACVAVLGGGVSLGLSRWDRRQARNEQQRETAP